MKSTYFCDYQIKSLRAGSLPKPFLVVSTRVVALGRQHQHRNGEVGRLGPDSEGDGTEEDQLMEMN